MTTTGDSDSASSGRDSDDQSSSRKSRKRRSSPPSENGKTSSRHKDKDSTKIIQIANIAPQAKIDEIQTLFRYIGKIDDIRLYPTVDLGMVVSSKICFLKFCDSKSVGLSQHLTNTVFIDRALIVVPCMESEIPDEQKGLELLGSGSLLPGIADPKLPQHVTSQLEGLPPNQVVGTHDPRLEESGLPAYPQLPPTLDTRRIEEIRRTVMLANLDPECTSQQVVEHFGKVGEVKYFRFCTRDNDPLQYGLLEFSEQPSILSALKLNGSKFGSKIIKVYHATQAIIKPQAKSNEAAQKEIEDALSRQSFLTQTLVESTTHSTATQHMGPKPPKRRSRSRERRRSGSRERKRSRSRGSRKRRSRSRSSRRRSTSRSRANSSRSKVKRSRSRSIRRDRRRSGSGSRRRSRSPQRHRRRGSRSRSRSKDKDRKEKKKDKKDKDRKDRDKDRDRDSRKKDRSEREKDGKERENGIQKEDAKMEVDGDSADDN